MVYIMSFSFLDNLDVDEVGSLEKSLNEVPETPIRLEAKPVVNVGSSISAKKKTKRSRDSSTFQSSNKLKDLSRTDECCDSQSSPPSAVLRRSKRIAKRLDDCSTDDKGNFKTKKEKKGRRKRGAKKSGKSELPTDDDHHISDVKTPPKNESSIFTVNQKAKSSTPYRTPPRQLKKLPTTPGPVRDHSLLKVALGNVAKKHSTLRSPKLVGEKLNATSFFKDPQPPKSQLFKEPKIRAVSTLEEVSKVSAKVRVNRTNRKTERTGPGTFKETAPIIKKKELVEHVRPEKRSINQATAIKRPPANDSVTDTKSPPTKLPKYQTITIMSNSTNSVNQRRIPIRNRDANKDAMKPHGTQSIPPSLMGQEPLPKVPSKSIDTVKTSVAQKALAKQGHRKSSEIRESLKSIVKKPTLKQNKAKTAARVTIALAALTEKIGKNQGEKLAQKEVNVIVPRKSFKLADQYKHVQSKVAQLIHGTATISAVPKVRSMTENQRLQIMPNLWVLLRQWRLRILKNPF
ncbi:uncharacterized protein LOC111249352 isoform X2 [Varroa destructor]|uniref:Uncharacterized protein n=1 Tax=Varroa destructor TaxID=109461 RepID=A0A7M7JY28_VARDE|nr:uncharacterized protein LOC111249352 isoform X2 [Varroa destructor]